MRVPDRLFLMVDEQHSYAELVSGPDACAAVESHYATLDAWCSPPPDAEISEEFLMFLYEIPAHLVADVGERFEDLDGDEMAQQVSIFTRENPSVTPVEVNVTYTAAEGAKASELPAFPDRFSTRREG
jgi:hypothetical protein